MYLISCEFLIKVLPDLGEGIGGLWGLGEGLTIVADIFELFEIWDDLTFAQKLHKEVVLIRIEVIEDEIFTVVYWRDTILVQLLYQFFLSDHEDIRFLQFLRVDLLWLVVKVEALVLRDLVLSGVHDGD